MKLIDKGLLFWPLIFPYLILFALICMFTNTFMETVFQNNGFYLIFTLIAVYIIASASSIIFFVKSIFKKVNSQELLYTNMIIKLIQIPAYILIFVFGLLCLLTIFTIAISIVLMIFDCIAIFLTGLIGMAGIIRCFIENKITKKTAIIYAVLQFIFCADVIACVKIYRKVKRLNGKGVEELSK